MDVAAFYGVKFRPCLPVRDEGDSMSSKGSTKEKSASAVQLQSRAGGEFVPGGGGSARVRAAKEYEAPTLKSPLSGIVLRIMEDPAYGAKLLYEAGITTKTGRLTKSYSG
jgi:hypothetical protein